MLEKTQGRRNPHPHWTEQKPVCAGRCYASHLKIDQTQGDKQRGGPFPCHLGVERRGGQGGPLEKNRMFGARDRPHGTAPALRERSRSVGRCLSMGRKEVADKGPSPLFGGR